MAYQKKTKTHVHQTTQHFGDPTPSRHPKPQYVRFESATANDPKPPIVTEKETKPPLATGKKVAYWLAGGSLATLLAVNGGMAYAITSGYMDTLKWNTLGDDVPMAEQSIDFMYDRNPNSRKAKDAFNKLANQMVNENGALTSEATKANEQKLKNYLDTMSKPKDSYSGNYALIHDKLTLQQNYDNLFSSQNRLKAKVSPQTIAKMFSQTNELMDSLYAHNADDAQIKQLQKLKTRLIHDIDIINQIVDVFNEAFNVNGDKTKVTLNEAYQGNIETDVQSLQRQLYFHWESLGFITVLLENSRDARQSYQKELTAYQNYQRDQEQKTQAYAAWEEEKRVHAQAKAAQKQFAEEQKRQESQAAIDAERQRQHQEQEAEQAEQELDKERQRQEQEAEQAERELAKERQRQEQQRQAEEQRRREEQERERLELLNPPTNNEPETTPNDTTERNQTDDTTNSTSTDH